MPMSSSSLTKRRHRPVSPPGEWNQSSYILLRVRAAGSIDVPRSSEVHSRAIETQLFRSIGPTKTNKQLSNVIPPYIGISGCIIGIYRNFDCVYADDFLYPQRHRSLDDIDTCCIYMYMMLLVIKDSTRVKPFVINHRSYERS